MSSKIINYILAILTDCFGTEYYRLIPCDKVINQYMYVKNDKGNYVRTWVIHKFSKNVTREQLKKHPYIAEAISPSEYKKIRKIHKRE